MIGLMTVMPVFPAGHDGIASRSGRAGAGVARRADDRRGDASSHPSLALWGGLMIKEVVVGLVVGMVLGAPIWSAQFTGDVIDSQRNATGQLPDPSSVDATVTGTVMSLTIMALYFASGCFQLTLRAIYDSYRTWPADRFTPMFNAGPVRTGSHGFPISKVGYDFASRMPRSANSWRGLSGAGVA
jgi:type III secretory pathway component EscT